MSRLNINLDRKIVSPHVVDLRQNLKKESRHKIAGSFLFCEIKFKKLPVSLWLGGFIVFAALVFIFIVAIKFFSIYENLQKKKGEVLGISEMAFQNLTLAKNSIKNFDLKSLGNSLEKSLLAFRQARVALKNSSFIATSIINLSPEGVTFKKLLKIGEDLSESILAIINELDNIQSYSFEELAGFSETLKKSLIQIEDAQSLAKEIDIDIIPQDKRGQFEELKELLPFLKKNINDISESLEALLVILGEKNSKRYLFVFQNENELRPTGGFIGSLAFLDVDQGEIKKIEFPEGGSYEFQGTLSERVLSPRPLWFINPHWQAQDANWFSDFPTSAKKLQWFLERSGALGADGVIAINSAVVERLLAVVGSISVSEYNVTIDSHNFQEETTRIVESLEERVTTKPKRFLKEVIKELLPRIFDCRKEECTKLLKVVLLSLKEKDLLLYFNNPALQKWVGEHKFGGEIINTDGDYLYVNNANVGGGKSNKYISQEIEQNIEVQEDGSIIKTVNILTKYDCIPKENETCFRNIDYLKLYVPKGSKLIDASGDFLKDPQKHFEEPEKGYKEDELLKEIEKEPFIHTASGTRITQEFDRVAYGNIIWLEAQNIKRATFKYKLPWNIKDKNNLYTLYVQKQPGGRNIKFRGKLIYPNNFKALRALPLNKIKKIDQAAEFTSGEVRDDYYVLLFE